MDKIIQEVFKYKKFNFDKLIQYGFERAGDNYAFEKRIVDGQMRLKIFIKSNGDINTQMIDIDTNEEYTLFLVDDAQGSFVGRVREDYQNALEDIANECCETQIFKSNYAKLIIEYVDSKYGDRLEYLWEKFPDNAIWRRADNKKWYGLILTVKGDKIGLDNGDNIEIIVMRANTADIENLVDNKKIYRGYHMNKNHWITMRLDGTCEFNEICKRLDISYDLAKKK